MSFPRDACDIFFADNASADGSVEWVRKRRDTFPFPISIIENSKNLGFAGGNNRAITEALRNEKYSYIALLNVDSAVDPAWLSRLVERANEDDTIGAAQSLILLHDTNLINTSGNVLHYLGFGWSGEYREKLPITNYQLPIKDIGYASGAAVLYRASALRKVGLLEERFFMYHEDMELSWRLSLAGYRITCAQKSIVYHKYQFSRNKKKWFWVERNRLLTFFTMYRLRTIFVFMPAFLFTELGIVAYSLMDGWFAQKMQSYGDVFGSFSWIRKKRQAVNALRIISDREAVSLMVSRLDFPEIKNPLVWGAGFFLEAYFKIIRAFIK
ncbi:MAG: glycosyltransferase family 2 protein [Candidatus Jacksonbacteria bacterium]|nr:glycosyltransferase family 2 protein [Candidatus Jacksonbacteria bacterium]